MTYATNNHANTTGTPSPEAGKPQRGRGPLGRVFGAACALAVVAGGGIGAYYYVTGKPVDTAMAGGSAPVDLAGVAKTNPFAAHALQAGANTCAASYAAVGKALTDGSQYMVKTGTSKQDRGRHALQGVVGMQYQNDSLYSGAAAGVVFSAPVGKSCETQTVRVIPLPQSCENAVAMLPKGATPAQPLENVGIYQLADGGQVMLVPATNGCVAVSVQRLST